MRIGRATGGILSSIALEGVHLVVILVVVAGHVQGLDAADAIAVFVAGAFGAAGEDADIGGRWGDDDGGGGRGGCSGGSRGADAGGGGWAVLRRVLGGAVALAAFAVVAAAAVGVDALAPGGVLEALRGGGPAGGGETVGHLEFAGCMGFGAGWCVVEVGEGV